MESNKFIEDIKQIVEIRGDLTNMALEQYTPLVNSIIASKNKDVNHICHTLDFLLDFCFDDRVLLLFRRLCRYLYDLDQVSTASYIQIYFEMWDEDGEKFGYKKE